MNGYLSAYDPKAIELIFDLHMERYVSHIDFYNYFNEQSKELAKRGMKDIEIFGSNDKNDWKKICEPSLEMALSVDFKQQVQISSSYRYFKLVCITENGIGNHNDKEYQEGLFGLNKVKFYNKDRLYRDVFVTANSVMQQEREHAWIWLQDGVVIDDNLYFVPLVITGDQTQPEGLQFKVLGIASFKTPIVDGEIKPELSTHKLAPISAYDKESAYFYGAGMMSNTKQAGAANPDGYVYVYGYKTTWGLRQLIVARVKAEDFELFDEWQYFNGKEFVYDILQSKPILDHISCEMSVSPILKGETKGK